MNETVISVERLAALEKVAEAARHVCKDSDDKTFSERYFELRTTVDDLAKVPPK